MIGGGRALLPEILSQSDRVGAKFEQAAITAKRYEIGCQLLLITTRKEHTGFRLVPTSMTLNDLERRNSPYFAFFTEFDRFSGRLYHSGWRYNGRKILSPSSSLLLLAKTITHPAARSLCDSWASCYIAEIRIHSAALTEIFVQIRLFSYEIGCFLLKHCVDHN